MSCSNAPSSSRSGRATRRVSADASAAASIRCRSTVKRCTALCCGLHRTAAHSGISRDQQPGLVQRLEHRDRRLGPRQAWRRVRRGRRPARAPATASAPPRAGAAVYALIGRPACAAAAATRSTRTGSAAGSASRARWTSSSCATTPSASGRRTGPLRRLQRRAGRLAASTRRQRLIGGEGDRAAGVEHPRASASSASSTPSAAATGSCSCCTSRSLLDARAERRCSSPRTSSSQEYAARTRSSGPSATCAAATAFIAWTSRSPPRHSLRSGSSRKASSPQRSARARTASTSSGSRLRASRRQVENTSSCSWSLSARSPATCRASSRPRAALRSVARDRDRLLDRTHRVVETHAGVPDRIPERVGDSRDVHTARGAAAAGRGRCRRPVRAGRTHPPRPARHRRRHRPGRGASRRRRH